MAVLVRLPNLQWKLCDGHFQNKLLEHLEMLVKTLFDFKLKNFKSKRNEHCVNWKMFSLPISVQLSFSRLMRKDRIKVPPNFYYDMAHLRAL
jgi:hypothetical protein